LLESPCQITRTSISQVRGDLLDGTWCAFQAVGGGLQAPALGIFSESNAGKTFENLCGVATRDAELQVLANCTEIPSGLAVIAIDEFLKFSDAPVDRTTHFVNCKNLLCGYAGGE